MRVASILSMVLVIVHRTSASCEWLDGYACEGSVIVDVDLEKDECIDACRENEQNGGGCVCVTWLKNNAAQCRLETGPRATFRGDGSPYEGLEMVDCDEATESPTTESPTTASPTASPTRNCDDVNIDGFLNECSADFPAQREALAVVDARVTQLTFNLSTLESAMTADLDAMSAMTADLDATDIAVDVLSSRLEVIEADIPVEKEAFDSLEARVTQLSGDLSALQSESATSTDLASAVNELSSRFDSIELTLSRISSARMAPAQLDSVPSSTNVSSWILGDKDVFILASLAFSAVLLTALLVVQCRAGKGYKYVRSFTESEAELAQ